MRGKNVAVVCFLVQGLDCWMRLYDNSEAIVPDNVTEFSSWATDNMPITTTSNTHLSAINHPRKK